VAVFQGLVKNKVTVADHITLQHAMPVGLNNCQKIRFRPGL